MEPERSVRKLEFTTPEVAKLLKVPQRKVLSMHERGYIRASIEEAHGHGSRRLYSFSDLVKAMAILMLEQFGMSVAVLRSLAGRWDAGVGFSSDRSQFYYAHTGMPGNPEVQKMSELVEKAGGIPVMGFSVRAIERWMEKRITEG